MADIDLERKKSGGMGWLWWALGLLALLLIVWWVWPDGDDDEFVDVDRDPVETVAPAATPEPAGVSIGDILASPDDYIGQSFPGAEVTVAEVPTDRGFWIEHEGQRLFAIIIDQPQEQRVDINPGQTLRIEGGMLRDQSYLPNISGDPLDANTEELAEQQEIFLVVDEAEITVLEGGEPQAGTDPAEAVQPDQ